MSDVMRFVKTKLPANKPNISFLTATEVNFVPLYTFKSFSNKLENKRVPFAHNVNVDFFSISKIFFALWKGSSIGNNFQLERIYIYIALLMIDKNAKNKVI